MWLLTHRHQHWPNQQEVLNGGSVCEALADITGGVSQSFFTTDPRIKELIEGGRLWHKFKKYLAKSYVLACCKYVPDGGSEADPATGLLLNHAYSVLHLKEVGALKFVKVRNPWGQGVWHGDWSDGWSKWDQHPDVESALLDDPDCGFDRNVRDGTFWMVRRNCAVHGRHVCHRWPPPAPFSARVCVTCPHACVAFICARRSDLGGLCGALQQGVRVPRLR